MSTLPRLLVLTDRTQTVGRPLVEVVRIAVHGGARAVVLREKDLPTSERAALAAALRPHVEVLLVASDPTLTFDGGPADGVHLAAADPTPQPAPALVGRSCHDAGELDGARRQGCHYVTVSPAFSSRSKPGYGPALGIDALRGLVATAGVPVFALGGVTPTNAAACLEAGAHGVAVMGEVMRAADPASTVAALGRAIAGAGGEP
ncbi:thiamine phosphate synthase [Rhabdothermincola sediminis]|uniref:thiamine phosphate synthase n=1 Tax=Rhabdothermincola sediminis TaxID=2751370 RepID=UPI001AA0929A|nr:thiamine phosphate synthase [Rhabdothermincola sediminis]